MKKNKNYKHFYFEWTEPYPKKIEPFNKFLNRIKESAKNKKLKSISTTTILTNKTETKP